MTPEKTCPVCGCELWFEPWSGEDSSLEICPCCGIQFGYTDMADGSHAKRLELYSAWRRSWIDQGMRWRGVGSKPPADWDPIAQLQRLHIERPK